jgi:hypothetical protein
MIKKAASIILSMVMSFMIFTPTITKAASSEQCNCVCNNMIITNHSIPKSGRITLSTTEWQIVLHKGLNDSSSLWLILIPPQYSPPGGNYFQIGYPSEIIKWISVKTSARKEDIEKCIKHYLWAQGLKMSSYETTWFVPRWYEPNAPIIGVFMFPKPNHQINPSPTPFQPLPPTPMPTR